MNTPSAGTALHWVEHGQTVQASWVSSHGWPAPSRLVVATDSLRADEAFNLVSRGTAILWQGDFVNGRQLLQALKRRIDKRRPAVGALPYPERFHRVRLARAQAARGLGLLLVRLDQEGRLPLRRAPDVQPACHAAYGSATGARLMPLTELLGALSAHQWQTQGLWLDALQAKLYPRHGVFAPTRHEYLTLISKAPLPIPCERALDVGTGTGILACLLAKRGVGCVMATDLNPQALACAQATVETLALSHQVNVTPADLFVPGRFDLVVCNPPWLPGRASSALEAAVYDPDNRMLGRFLRGVANHLTPTGQAWLVLSDLAERLALRTRDELMAMIRAGGLQVLGKDDIAPTHGKRQNPDDPLADARRAEITSLWRLTLAETP